jgi:DUF1016 N-terminal domain
MKSNKASRPSSKAAVELARKPPSILVKDLRALILQSRDFVALTVNTGLTMLYWHIGDRLLRDVLQDSRGGYGEKIVQTVSGQLTAEFGRGFSRANLFQMISFAESFPDATIVQTLSGKLSWSHFILIIRLGDPLKRDFYAEMCRIEGWSVRTLDQKMALHGF